MKIIKRKICEVELTNYEQRQAVCYWLRGHTGLEGVSITPAMVFLTDGAAALSSTITAKATRGEEDN